MRYKGSEPERDGWSLLTIGADLEPLDDEELNQRLSAGCIGAAAESGASWMHNVVRGLGIAALKRVQISGIEVSTVDLAEGKQINTICKGMLLTALGDDNISEGSCYLVSDLGTVERIENAGALLARMQGQGGQLEVLEDEDMQYPPVTLSWTGGGRQKPNGIYFNRFTVTHLPEGWTACTALQSLSDAAVSVKMGDPLTSALSGDGFCAGAFKLSSECASGHGRNFVAVYSRASELHFVPWMHVEALEGGAADQATKADIVRMLQQNKSWPSARSMGEKSQRARNPPRCAARSAAARQARRARDARRPAAARRGEA